MTTPHARRAFRFFHAVLGLGLLTMGLIAMWHGLEGLDEPGHLHFALVGGLEAVGAALFLVPRTLRVGGALLLLVLLPSFILHVARGEWEFQLLIYAAGVWFVMAHGPAWGRHEPTTPTGT